ncbi:MAG: lysylphosphatidylglycerol synthase transmembrane domain-containing protein [Pelolinea sp.]|nr:lysylphosphatidylglycerol synthase transmembrane domain-containing protein [Pelolinea sp.]
MKRWLFWVGLLISAFSLFFALRGLQLTDVWVGIRSAKFIWVFPGIIIYFLGVWMRSVRWHFFLRPINNISVKEIFPIVTIGYMGNNIYPARAGELLRAVVLKHNNKTPISASLTTIVIERIFDGVIMLGFIIFNFPKVTNLPGMAEFTPTIQKVTLWGSIFFISALIFFIVAAIFSDKVQKILLLTIGKILPEKWQGTFQSIIKKIFFGLRSLSSFYDMVIILLISIIIWLLETGFYWFVMLAFPFRVSFSTLMLLNGILNLLTIIPSSPGYIGTFDAPSIALLTAFGVKPEISASYTLLLHAVLWLPITVVGGVFFGKIGLNWSKEMSQAKTERAS